MPDNKIVIGSLSQISQTTGKSLAESFMSASTILLLDCSGSMDTHDAPGGLSRERAAQDALVRLQKENPGSLAIVCFADYAVFSPTGLPVNCGGSTNMASALKYVQPADDTGTRFILISDGSPNSEQETLKVASEFKTPIQTVYIGPEMDYEGGRAFLEKLSKLTGGKSVKSDAPGLLGEPVEKLLLAK